MESSTGSTGGAAAQWSTLQDLRSAEKRLIARLGPSELGVLVHGAWALVRAGEEWALRAALDTGVSGYPLDILLKRLRAHLVRLERLIGAEVAPQGLRSWMARAVGEREEVLSKLPPVLCVFAYLEMGRHEGPSQETRPSFRSVAALVAGWSSWKDFEQQGAAPDGGRRQSEGERV
jgi:hypothetical protein